MYFIIDYQCFKGCKNVFFVKQEALEWGICNSLFWEEENIIKLRNTIGVKCW